MHTGETKYGCKICSKSFAHRAGLYLHKRAHEKPFSCDLCKSRFWKESSMLTHYNNHKGEFITCDTCQKSFASQTSLEEHIKKIHSNVSVECNACHVTFPSETHLAIHSQTHLKEINGEESDVSCNKEEVTDSKLESFVKPASLFNKKPLTCDICRKGFFEEAQLTRHFLKHVKGKGYICDVCNKVFPNLTSLVNHKRTHSGERPFKCPKEGCDKAFAQKGNLTFHLKLHSKERPFNCDVCNMSFNRKFNMTLHMQRHTKTSTTRSTSKPRHTCDMCPKSFSRLNMLQGHKYTEHGNEQSNRCPVCEEVYFYPADLAMHMKTHKVEPQEQGTNLVNPFECNVCKKTFNLHQSLLDHKKEHGNLEPTACPLCGVIFSCPADLAIHSKTHGGTYLQEKTDGDLDPALAAMKQRADLQLRMKFIEGLGPQTVTHNSIATVDEDEGLHFGGEEIVSTEADINSDSDGEVN